MGLQPLLKHRERQPLERTARRRRRRQPVGALLLLEDAAAIVAECGELGILHAQRRTAEAEVDA